MEPFSTLIVGPAIGGTFLGIGLLIRRWTRDRLEIAKDRAEQNVYQLLIQQRDHALAEVMSLKVDLAAIAEENEDAIETIRELTTKNEQMRAQVSMLSALVRRLAAIQKVPVSDDGDSTIIVPQFKFTSRSKDTQD